MLPFRVLRFRLPFRVLRFRLPGSRVEAHGADGVIRMRCMNTLCVRCHTYALYESVVICCVTLYR